MNSSREFEQIRRIRSTDFIWALAAFLGVMILGTLQGIMVAVLLSVLALLYLAGHPPVYVVGRKPGTDVSRPLEDQPGDETFVGLLMLRMEGLMFFTSAPRALDSIIELVREYQPEVLVLDCRAVPSFEYTALMAFDQFDEKLSEMGVTLWLAALNRDAFETVEKSSLWKTLGHERMFFNMQQAVDAYKEKVGIKNANR